VVKRVEEALKKYNAYRSPEATGELVGFDGKRVIVKIKGTFTETCGVNDWIEDLIYTLEDECVKARIIAIKEPDNPLEVGEERIVIIEIVDMHECG
jgi:hypothetical protein